MLFDEKEADEAVARVLANVNKRSYRPMKVFKNTEGQIVCVVDTEPITRQQIVEGLDEAKGTVKEFEDALRDYDALTNETPAQPDQPTAAPADQTAPVETPQTGAGEVPVSSEAPAAAPTNPEQPEAVNQDQNTTPPPPQIQ